MKDTTQPNKRQEDQKPNPCEHAFPKWHTKVLTQYKIHDHRTNQQKILQYWESESFQKREHLWIKKTLKALIPYETKN